MAAIVIAAENDRRSNIGRYGLQPTDKTVSLETLNSLLADSPRSLLYKTVAFINGLHAENLPQVFSDMASAALRLRTSLATRTYFLTRNVKVAGNGLEALFREAKQAGVFFFKLSESGWKMEHSNPGGVKIEFTDDLDDQHWMVLPDIAVIDDTVTPSKYLQHLARVMHLHCDPYGFPQSENIHRLPVHTNRRGIFVAGPSRAVINQQDMAADAAAVAGAVMALHNGPTEPVLPTAHIDTALCVRCLTCLRLCPHKAVEKETSIFVSEPACEGCGICVSECPRKAITIEADWMDPKPSKPVLASPETDIAITVFCCSRSAWPALTQGLVRPEPMSAELTTIEVPCAGSVSRQHIVEAFARGASGVLVLGCHEGNCHSEIGTTVCRNRVEALLDLLTAMGLERQRLHMTTLAAQMDHEAVDALNRFTGMLKDLNPSSESHAQ